MYKSKIDPVDLHVGRRIREARLTAGMSQVKLGDRVKLSYQQIQKYEKGTNQTAVSRLVQFGEIFNRPVAWFFEGIERCNGAVAAPEPPHILRGTREEVALAKAFLTIKSDGAKRAIIGLAQAAEDHNANPTVAAPAHATP